MFFTFKAEKACIARLDNHNLVREVDNCKDHIILGGVLSLALYYFSPLVYLGVEYFFSSSTISYMLPRQILFFIGLFLMYHSFKHWRLYDYAMAELKSRL